MAVSKFKKKEFSYRGKSLEDLQDLSVEEFAQLVPTSLRRKLLKGMTDSERTFIKKFDKKGNNVKTHCRDMVVLPIMVNKTLNIYNGKDFQRLDVMPEMLGHRLGEFVLSRRRVTHSSPGVGATRSSANVSVK